MNPKVDMYLMEGCGRCDFYQTENCKVHSWTDELKVLRQIVLDCGLEEEYKWSQPCYTFQNKNVLIVTAFRDFASLAFFKGALLKDKKKYLHAPGENSQASRQFRFTSVKEIVKMEPEIKAYIFEAIEIEKAGLKIDFKKETEPWPDELVEKFEEFPGFKTAFKSLTPGRQRGYILHFSQPKQYKTRMARIEKYMPNILRGEGINDNYKSR